MDMKVLQECVRANVGDLTFEEAYIRSKRVLNISVSSSRTQEVPQLLNYLTAPNVVSLGQKKKKKKTQETKHIFFS